MANHKKIIIIRIDGDVTEKLQKIGFFKALENLIQLALKLGQLFHPQIMLIQRLWQMLSEHPLITNEVEVLKKMGITKTIVIIIALIAGVKNLL